MLDETNCYDRLVYDEFIGLFPYHIRSALLSKLETRVYKAGELIMKKGDPGGWMANVASGTVRICLHSQDGREMLISMVKRGEIFGERAVFDGMPRAGEAYAEEDCVLQLFHSADLVPALCASSDAMLYLIKVLCFRIVRYMNTMELYAMQCLPIRVANFLSFLGHKYGQEKDGKIVIKLNLSQTDLSQQIASSRESVNRQMRALAAQGLISIEDETITICDLPGLEKICYDPEK